VSAARLLTPDAELPHVVRAPAPWTLHGDGWILLLRLPEEVRRDPVHMPSELQGRPLGGPSIVMFVDYADSPAGPYRELLYIPGRFALEDGQRAWSVTRIYVSSWDSVVNGRLNWGIPKDHAEFHRVPAGRGERLEVETGGRRIATLELAPRGPALPVHAGMLPATLRALTQFHGGRRFELVPGAVGRAGMASVISMASDPALFPALDAAKVQLAARIPRFTMTFPVASESYTPR
jgi:hypothetical protein